MSVSSSRRSSRSSKPPRPENWEEMFSGKTPAEMRALTTVDDVPEFASHAGQRLWTAALWIPRMVKLSAGASVVAIVAGILCMVALWTRDPPLLLVASPSGLTRCAPAPIDPATLKPLPRPQSHIEQCAWLEREYQKQSSIVAGPSPKAEA